jgi:hydrogenase/urease accessory protein HupE
VSFARSLFLAVFLLLTASLQAHPEWKEAYCIGVIDDEYVFDFKVKFDAPSYYVGKHPKEATIKELDALMYEPGRLAAAAAQAPKDFLRGTRVYADGVAVPLELVGFPTAAEVQTLSKQQGEADRYPVIMTARLRTKIPRDTGIVEVVYPEALGSVITNLRRGMDSQVLMTVAPGEKGLFKIGEVHFTLSGFLREGFEHVIPDGWDHCLFMLAMMLAAASVGEALRRSLVFTLGHAITLTLVITGTIPPVGNWIEPIIAATIALGGYLAYRQKPAQTAFVVVPLVFGLIHGLGFAAAAADKLQGIGPADLAKLLLGFNVGVEAAQAVIILTTAGILYALSKARLETSALRRILGLLIAIAGTAIMAARIWSLTKGA